MRKRESGASVCGYHDNRHQTDVASRHKKLQMDKLNLEFFEVVAVAAVSIGA